MRKTKKRPAGRLFIVRFPAPHTISKPSRIRPCLTKKSERCTHNNAACQQSKQEKTRKSEAGAVIPSVKRQNEYQGYRSGPPERTITISSMPVLVGAAMIAAAILLSTLLNAIGTRY